MVRDKEMGTSMEVGERREKEEGENLTRKEKNKTGKRNCLHTRILEGW